MNIRIEAGSLNRKHVTGIGYYTLRLIQALETVIDVHIDAFLLENTIDEKLPIKSSNSLSIHHIPRSQQLYRKLHQFGLATAFDRNLPPADVTIFPDFSIWPTRASRLNAVVIHDLTFIKYPQYMRVRKIGGLRLPVTTWYLSSVVRHAAKNADLIITISNSIKEDLISLLSVDPRKIIVTPIPTSASFLLQSKHTSSKAALCRKYNIKTPSYILSVGTIEPRKNQLATLKAYLKLPQEIRSTHSLVFAGGYGWGNDDFLIEAEKAKKAGEHIILTGYFDYEDSYGLYHHASLFTAASHYEGFGMPLLEAMATSTPLLVADIPVFHEVAGGAALYVDTSDTLSYTKHIKALIKDTSLRDDLVTRGLRQKDKYSWQQNAKKLTDRFHEMLGDNNK